MSRNSEQPADAVRFAYQVKALVPAINSVLSAVFKPLGLTCVQADALLVLAATGPVTLSALSELLVAEAGHPSRLIARLEERGLLSRTRSAVDGRATLISLTEAGEALAAEAEQARKPVIEAMTRDYGEELGAAAAFLARVRADLAE